MSSPRYAVVATATQQQHPRVDPSQFPVLLLRRRIAAMFDHYVPSKAHRLPVAFTRYEGREELLLRSLIHKFGPEPPLPALNLPADAQEELAPFVIACENNNSNSQHAVTPVCGEDAVEEVSLPKLLPELVSRHPFGSPPNHTTNTDGSPKHELTSSTQRVLPQVAHGARRRTDAAHAPTVVLTSSLQPAATSTNSSAVEVEYMQTSSSTPSSMNHHHNNNNNVATTREGFQATVAVVTLHHQARLRLFESYSARRGVIRLQEERSRDAILRLVAHDYRQLTSAFSKKQTEALLHAQKHRTAQVEEALARRRQDELRNAMLLSLSNALWQKSLLRREEHQTVERQERQELLRRHHEAVSKLYRNEKREGKQLLQQQRGMGFNRSSMAAAASDQQQGAWLVRYAAAEAMRDSDELQALPLRSMSAELFSSSHGGADDSQTSCTPSPRLTARAASTTTAAATKRTTSHRSRLAKPPPPSLLGDVGVPVAQSFGGVSGAAANNQWASSTLVPMHHSSNTDTDDDYDDEGEAIGAFSPDDEVDAVNSPRYSCDENEPSAMDNDRNNCVGLATHHWQYDDDTDAALDTQPQQQDRVCERALVDGDGDSSAEGDRREDDEDEECGYCGDVPPRNSGAAAAPPHHHHQGQQHTRRTLPDGGDAPFQPATGTTKGDVVVVHHSGKRSNKKKVSSRRHIKDIVWDNRRNRTPDGEEE